MSKKTGLVLSGGGAEGAYQAGIVRALVEGVCASTDGEPLDPTVITGTSIGAFSAAFLMGAWEPDGAAAVAALEDVWLERIAGKPTGENGAFRIRANPMEVMNPLTWLTNPVGPMMNMASDSMYLASDSARRIAASLTGRGSMAKRLIGLMNVDSFIDLEPWERLLRDEVDYAAIRAQTGRRKLRVVTTNWEKGRVRIYEENEMTDEDGWRILRASSAMPGFFSPIQIDDTIYYDGGVLMNTPLKPAIRAGADILHVINMNSTVAEIPLSKPRNTMETMYRQQLVEWGAALDRDIRRAGNYNDGLALLEGRGLDHPPSLKQVISAADRATRRRTENDEPYRYLTIHRYFPSNGRDDILALLDTRKKTVEDLIARGYEDAKSHNCIDNQCILAPETD